MNLEKFTDRARGFLQAAQTVAARMNHQRIAPAHLLKALLEDEQGMASGLIARAGGSAEAARRETDEALAKVPAVSGSGASAAPSLNGDTIRLLDQAEEIARLRGEQTRLARDVHDVVGHSLAVILAQAESAQFRSDSDTAAVRATLENIAVSARQSLREVRQVLSSTDDTATVSVVPTGSLDALVEGVQAAGNEVHSIVVGLLNRPSG